MGLFFGLLFGSIGGAYLVYAKRQHDTSFLVAGFILIIYPYFVSNVYVCTLIGIAVIAAPFVIRRFS